MGADVVSVGLRHKIRTSKPRLLAEDLSRRFNANVTLKYQFRESFKTINLLNLQKDAAICSIEVSLPTCLFLEKNQACFQKDYSVDIDSKDVCEGVLQNFRFSVPENLLYNNSLNCTYQVIVKSEDDSLSLNINFETVEILYLAPFRWRGFLDSFDSDPLNSYPEDAAILREYRNLIYRYAQMLGCSQVMYIADQGIGELILDKIHGTVDDLFRFINERKYYDEEEKHCLEMKEVGHWNYNNYIEGTALNNKYNSIIINIPNFINNRDLIDTHKYNIDILLDDFKDLKE